jgi:hypothetical protein
VDLTFANYNIYRELEKRMSKPKLYQKLIFASGAMIPVFARLNADVGCEYWNRPTGGNYHGESMVIDRELA